MDATCTSLENIAPIHWSGDFECCQYWMRFKVLVFSEGCPAVVAISSIDQFMLDESVVQKDTVLSLWIWDNHIGSWSKDKITMAENYPPFEEHSFAGMC